MKNKPINGRETLKHKLMKNFGKRLLKSLGAENIKEEYELSKDLFEDNNLRYEVFGISQKHIFVDVYGEIKFKNNIIRVVIECGLCKNYKKKLFIHNNFLVIDLSYNLFPEILVIENITKTLNQMKGGSNGKTNN